MTSLEYNDVLTQLQDYMLYDATIQKALRQKMVAPEKKSLNRTPTTKEPVKKESLFVPIEQDTLFWCYYILANGDAAYEMLPHKNSVITKQLKIDLVSLIRKSKDIVKMYKFDTITSIESNLANDAALHVKTFLTLCAIANINVIYISKKCYYESLMNDTGVIYIVKQQEQSDSKYVKKYGYQLGSQEMVDTIRQTLYKLDKIDKPIKAMSAYKVEELLVMCERLAIEVTNKETGKNKTKKDLYEAIVQYF